MAWWSTPPVQKFLITTADGATEALTPTNRVIRSQTTRGSSTVQPKRVQNAILSVSRAGKKLNEFATNQATGRLTDNDLTIISEDFFKQTSIKEISFSDEPDNVLHAVTEDGRLLDFS